MTAGMASVEASWLTWTHIIWFPVFMALGTFLAHLIRRKLASRRAQGAAAPAIAPDGVDVVSLALGALLAAFVLWFAVGDAHAPLFYVRGLLNEPSMGLVAFSLFSLAHRGFGRETMIPAARRLLLATVLIGAGFYPLALGIGYFDPYALGYHAWFAVPVFVLALLMWWYAPLRGIAFWWTLALFAWSRQYPESDNLWDQLLDPILFSIALGSVLPRLVPRRARNFLRGLWRLASQRSINESAHGEVR